MSTLSLFFPLYFTVAALILTAIETTLLPNLGVPPICTPDLNLALVTFLASCSLNWRTFLAALGIAIVTPLLNSSPGILQSTIIVLIFLLGCRINQTIFMNNLIPQAFFAGCSKFIITLITAFVAAPTLPFSSTLLFASGWALTTALFAFPILSYLNSLQERFQHANPDSIAP